MSPQPNEYSCRLEDPDQFKRFARKNCHQKSGGKCIDVIFGIIEAGKSKIQALRYKKNIWSKEAARSHCKGRGGSFEATEEIMEVDNMVEQSCEDGKCVETAETTNSPPWGSIKKTKENFPNKGDFIIQRGDKWSDWKLPYRYKGKIHCGGVAAASQAAGGARQKKPMSLTSTERARLNRARKACGTGETKTSDEITITMSNMKIGKFETIEDNENVRRMRFELMDDGQLYNNLRFTKEALVYQYEQFQRGEFPVLHGMDHSGAVLDTLGDVVDMELIDDNGVTRCFVTVEDSKETFAQQQATILFEQGRLEYVSGGWKATIGYDTEIEEFQVVKPWLREVSSTNIPAKTDAKRIENICMDLLNQISTTENTAEGEEDIPMEELEMDNENPEPIVEPSTEGEKVEKGVELQPLDAEQASKITERMDAFEAGQNATIRAGLLERAVEFELSEEDFEGQSNETIEFALKVANKVRMSTLRVCNPDNPLGGEGDSTSEMTTEEITANYYNSG